MKKNINNKNNKKVKCFTQLSNVLKMKKKIRKDKMRKNIHFC